MNKLKSNDQYPVGRFRPHGHYVLDDSKTYFHAIAEGPFNLEFMNSLSKLWDANTKEWSQLWTLKTRPGTLIELRNSMMMPADALAAYAEFVQENSSGNFATSARALVVPDDIEGRVVMLPLLINILTTHSGEIPFRVFDTVEAAKQWLESVAQLKST
jgi:hypothetical protein